LQILFLNLVTDTFPAFAIATARGSAGVMDRPPRPPDEPLLGKVQWRCITVHGLVLTATTFLAMFMAGVVLALEGAELVTVTFLTLAFAQLWHVFNMIDPQLPPLRSQLVRSRWVWGAIVFCAALLLMAVYVPAASAILSLTPPSLPMWALIFGLSLLPLIVLRVTAVLRR
jgi:Ca2+-transporting ATPase